MNRLIIPILAGAALASLAWPAGPDDPKVAPARHVLTRWLDEANVNPPVQVGSLTVFPITLSRQDRLSGLLTLREALAKGLLVVEELDTADVNQARFVNKSTDMVFLMAGEVLTGGKQNRTLATDALLGPRSSTVLPVYCVQKGRWEGKKDFAPAVTVAPQLVREKAAQSAGQKEVWAEVARANQRLKTATPSEDLAEAMGNQENARTFAELRRRVTGKLPEATAGVVVAVGGQLVGADLFNSAELFSSMRASVLDSYFSQYSVGAEDRAEKIRPEGPSQQQVRDYLQGCYRSRFQAEDMRGIGQVYRLSGARTGQTLSYEPVRGKLRPAEAAVTEYMVHTALMRQAVPVPLPLPVRPLPRGE